MTTTDLPLGLSDSALSDSRHPPPRLPCPDDSAHVDYIFNQLKPSSLPHVQFRLSEDILEALMIGVDITQITQQIVPPDF